ncbi:MAG: CotH kinase family protein, partial [Pirellulales bacterium]
LVPTAADDAAIGSNWTGTAVFNDATWQDVVTGVGFEQDAPPPVPTLRNVALNKPATTNGTLYAGMFATSITDGNRFSIVHGDGPGGNAGVAEAVGFRYEINLGATYNLERIDVFPRQDGCCPDRLTRYRVSVHLDNVGSAGAEVWSADMRMDGSTPPAGPTPPDSLSAALDLDGSFQGQWVRITSLQNPNPNYTLQLGEVEVFSLVAAPPDQVNQALGAPVTASGPLYPNFPNPQLITDGNRGTFTHPATEVASFSYTIDLGTSKSIEQIKVVNRGDGCCPERLTKYRVSVHIDDDGEFGPAVWSADVRTDGTNSGAGGVDVLMADLDPDGEFAGRFVRLEKIDDGTTHYWPQLAEVEVFSPTGYNEAIATDVETSMQNVNASAYLRVPFTVADPGAYDTLTLRIRDDDGFVGYLNGVEIARRNAPVGTPGFDAAATASHFAAAFSLFSVPAALLRAGENVLAIHGLNVAADDGDFLILPQLVAASIETGVVGYLPDPTPAEPNGTTVAGFVADTTFDILRGFFSAPQDIEITTKTPGATIVYTTDGSVPTLTHGMVVPPADAMSEPVATLHLTTTTVVRAAAFKEGFEPTNIDTQTYLYLNDVIHQPTNPPGVPASWQGFAADYQMDPDVVNNPAYSDEIIQGLRSIPTMSLVIDPEDLWSTADGIYIYPERLGLAYERPTSIEVINPDGSTFFQEDAGIRVWGTGWRPHSSTLKHAFQLKFKDIYGNAKLRHQLFPDAPVGAFDDLILRAQGSRGWTDFRSGGLEIEATQYIHDAWARDTAVAMGKHDGHSTHVHLYLNGLYWGLYNPVERPTGNFGEEYFGGTNADYDVISHRTGEPIVANEGDLVAWNQVMGLADAGLSTPPAYAQIEAMVDIENLIDYMLVNQYATNHDGPSNGGNNLRALRQRSPEGRFRFYFWDMEYTFWNQNENNNITDVDYAGTIGHLFARLRANAEFRQRFSDRAHLALTGTGALTPASAAARWQASADELYTAIIAESARWGDFRRPTNPYTRDVEWAAERNRLMTQYFPVRTGILIDQLRAVGLFNDVPVPQFNQAGGTVPSGFDVELSVPQAPVYIDTPLVAAGAPARVLVPANGSLGITWTQHDFTNFATANWTNGLTGTGVGYDHNTSVDYNPVIATNIGVLPTSAPQPTDVYVRQTFDLADLTAVQAIERLVLRMKYDDGFVAYLNGQEVARRLAPGTVGTPPAYNARATSGRADTLSLAFEDIDISAFRSHLRVGTNALAIHGLNALPTSSDFLILPELVARTLDPNPPPAPIYYTTDGTDPRLPGGMASATAQPYMGPIELLESTQIIARSQQGSSWSAPASALFTVPRSLRVDELMYHPAGDADAEFVELVNVGAVAIELGGVQLAGAVDFVFPAGSLAPGERVVVVRDLLEFEALYGTNIRVAGAYAGALDNAGETLTVLDAAGGVIQTFTYDDTGITWHASTDGLGPSLVILDPHGNAANWSAGEHWRPSRENGGSPGTADSFLGDFNLDTRVDLVDLVFLRNRLGTAAGADRLSGDLNGDGAVTRADLARFATRFGQSAVVVAPSPAASSVGPTTGRLTA